MYLTFIKYSLFGADGEVQPTKTIDKQTRTTTDRDKAMAEIIWSNLLPPGSFIMAAREVKADWRGRKAPSEMIEDLSSFNDPCSERLC